VIAADVRDTELADYQRAARTLLVHPLVTEHWPDRHALGLVRRFAVPLAADLEALAGYRLELAPSCARLVRRVDRFDPTQQIVRRRDRKAFDRRRYAYLCLVLAALGRAGLQVALTELADALRRRAADIDGLGFDPDEYRHRLAFVDVVRHLLDLGALREVATSTIDWIRDPEAGEALYDLDRDVLHQVVVPPRVIQHVRSSAALLADRDGDASDAVSRDARRAATRRRLVRLLLEHPVVETDDLDGGSRTYLASQGRALAEDLHRLTGAQLERRAEGAALIDATGGFTDRRFPAGGTPAQVALLLADAMARAVLDPDPRPTASVPRPATTSAETAARLDAARPGSPPPDGTGAAGPAAAGDPVPALGGAGDLGPLFTDAWLVERAGELCASHGQAFAAELRSDPAALAAAALDVLVAFDLVRGVPGGVVARPAIARYRDLVVEVAPGPQLTLLDQPTDTAVAGRP
jgi:uncharacterized protein (TIGR02678 family)